MDVHICVCVRNRLLFKVALIFPKSNKSCVLHSHLTCRPGLARGTLGGVERLHGVGAQGESTTDRARRPHSCPCSPYTLQTPLSAC